MKLIMQMNNVWKTEHDRSIKGIEYNKRTLYNFHTR